MRGLVRPALVGFALHGILASAQTASPRGSAAAGAPAAGRELRITHVSLYKNGVGFFEHEGTVSGNAAVQLDLTSAQLNDVLQSLTVLDLGGGHITGANYNSATPFAQQLGNLPLSLGETPTQEALFNALRGARVEVSGAGAVFTGRILALEVRATAADGAKAATERRVLTVVADSGATRTLELSPATTVRLLDAQLRGDLNAYLALLAGNRTEGIRHLTLMDRGTGTRALRVSFLSEVPVWKSTYRVLLTESTTGVAPVGGATATVQGFSVVDNTTGEDWKDVRLSLIAGSPQSFLQPIAQPVYDRRPEVPVAANVQTTPQTHESAEGVAPPGSASADLSSGAGGGPASLFGSPTGKASARRISKNTDMMKDTGPPAASETVAVAAAPELYEEQAARSVAAKASTAAFDDFFAYNLPDPVTIPRNGSALVPILQAKLPVESVTLWSAQDPQPLRALWLTNSSADTLDRGSFSVIENGEFAGEGLIDPLHPGERRLLSYAADQAVRVTPAHPLDASRVSSLAVNRGVLHVTNTEVSSTQYIVNNAASVPRVVVVETPRRDGWTLDAPATAAETTPGAYRFRLAVQPHAAAQVTVSERHVLDQYFRLADSSEEQLTLYLNNADSRVVAQLRPVFESKRRVAEVQAQLAVLRARERTIGEDQKRLRENLAALKTSAEERALVRRYTTELNAQEDALNELHRQIGALEAQLSAAQAELNDRIANLQIAETGTGTGAGGS